MVGLVKSCLLTWNFKNAFGKDYGNADDKRDGKSDDTSDYKSDGMSDGSEGTIWKP